MQYIEDIAMDPDDLLLDSVDCRIVFGASEDIRVLFDGENLLPASRPSERDGVAASSSERIYHDGPRLWRRRDMFLYNVWEWILINTITFVVSHPYAFIVSRKDLVALMPVL